MSSDSREAVSTSIPSAVALTVIPLAFQNRVADVIRSS
jgi:hypothetical protein